MSEGTLRNDLVAQVVKDHERDKKEAERDFYAHQAKSLTNKDYHDYAQFFLRVMTDDEIFTHIKWSISDTARYFGVGWCTVRYWIETGKLKAEHELTEMKGAKNFRWRWWVYVRDVIEMEEQYKQIQDTTIARRFKVDAVWKAKVAIAKSKEGEPVEM